MKYPVSAWLLALPLLLCGSASVQANVYATNVKVNGSLSTTGSPVGSRVNIGYTLNEAASGGVTIQIASTNAVVRTLSVAGGSAGTTRGTNTVVWDGNDGNGVAVPVGPYMVTITASSAGHSTWTQITDDLNDGNAVWEGRGIAVDQNTNSPYYGRVFVANSQFNDPGANHWLGYQVGILKCNADGSYADEGGTSTGGYPWAGDSFSPWHVQVSKTDRVYVGDLSTNGQVVSWDPTISTNTQLSVLRPDNWTNSATLSGPALWETGTNRTLWMADASVNDSQRMGLGVLTYSLLPDGTSAQGDKGKIAVALGGSLTNNPVDVALDKAGNIYAIQGSSEPSDASNRVFQFPAFVQTSNSVPTTQANWAIGKNDDTMAGANGVAVDPSGTYVAVAFTGLFNSGSNGCTQVYYATNGARVVNIDLGMTISGFSDHQDEDCAWDAVGNLYYIDNIFGVWRAVSPPGTNFSTTIAVPMILVGGTAGGTVPVITSISQATAAVTIDFTAGTNDTAGGFSVIASPNVDGQYSVVNGVTVQATSTAGQFKASVPVSSGNPTEFFRIKH